MYCQRVESYGAREVVLGFLVVIGIIDYAAGARLFLGFGFLLQLHVNDSRSTIRIG